MRSSLLFAFAIGCGSGPSTPDAPADGFDRNAMLAHLATNVLAPMHAQLVERVGPLAPAIEAHCDALDTGGGTPDAAQLAWRSAMVSVDRFDASIVGPAAMNNKAQRDRIYGWPLLSTCFLDRDTASQFADPNSYDVSTRLANARSLAAVEYLLFNTSANHTCVTEPAGWAALGNDLPKARCRLAVRIAEDATLAAVELAAAWDPFDGNFVAELANAGGNGSTISTAQEGANRISDGMFFVDRIVKDMKLAEPAGIAINACGTVGEPCLIEVEHPFSDDASIAVRSNLRGLREVFTGTTASGDGPGFDDFLIGVGHGDVATRMTQSLDSAISAADALPDSFLDALQNNRASIEAAHTAIRAFTDDLKSQFLTLLSLEIPDDVATDND